MTFTVMRSPCLMEDEGRHFEVRSFNKREDAEAWIAAQEGNYFAPSQYYIEEQQEVQEASSYEDLVILPDGPTVRKDWKKRTMTFTFGESSKWLHDERRVEPVGTIGGLNMMRLHQELTAFIQDMTRGEPKK